MYRAPRFPLNNQRDIPVLGLSTRRLHKEDCYDVIRYAMDIGFRHFDTAPAYLNEKEVGEAIGSKLAESRIKREELFISSKLEKTVRDAGVLDLVCRQRLRNLQVDYLDLFLLEAPEDRVQYVNETSKIIFYGSDNVEMWSAMESLVDDGLVRSIGLVDFKTKQIRRLLENCRLKPVVNQIECHICYTQDKLRKFCRKQHIDIIAHHPLGFPAGDCDFTKNTKIHEIAKKYGKMPTQVVLRFLLQLGVYPLPMSACKQRLYLNYNVFDFALDDEDMQYLRTIEIY